jgi:hypothetical protein
MTDENPFAAWRKPVFQLRFRAIETGPLRRFTPDARDYLAASIGSS